MFYLVKMPAVIRQLKKDYLWKVDTDEKVVYLTFDDGPNLTATPYVLNELKKHNAKATFFCVGKNVVQHPDLYKRILTEGHVCGNHTHNHLNGYATKKAVYLQNIQEASGYIETKLFRPPYGRIKSNQEKALINAGYTIVMWHILSGDFDTAITGEQCLQNVLRTTHNGSIIVFHDSDKAFVRMQHALPKFLAHFSNLGYSFRAITESLIRQNES